MPSEAEEKLQRLSSMLRKIEGRTTVSTEDLGFRNIALGRLRTIIDVSLRSRLLVGKDLAQLTADISRIEQSMQKILDSTDKEFLNTLYRTAQSEDELYRARN
jgi:hypothetical protein